MTRRIPRHLPFALLIAAAVALSSCGMIRDSKLNPRNWFKGSRAEATVSAEAVPGDPRPLVAEVTELTVSRMPGGAIVTASGLPPTQGWWDAELVPVTGEEAEEGVMAYRFLLAEPPGPRRVSTPQSREVTAGAFLSDIKLDGIGKIVVMGAGNSRSTSR
ncbi:MAG: hypothetical protein ACKVPY_06925 [Paracoccaceae bacterium]